MSKTLITVYGGEAAKAAAIGYHTAACTPWHESGAKGNNRGVFYESKEGIFPINILVGGGMGGSGNCSGEPGAKIKISW